MAVMIQPAQADITLAQLAAGQTISVGDKTFSEFSFVESGLNSFDPNAIIVTATSGPGGVDYLTFSGTMQLAGFTAVTLAGDLKLNYTVTATAGSIAMIDQLYTGGAVNGSILINETATSGANTAHSQLSAGFGPADVSDPNAYPYGPLTPIDLGEGDLLTIDPAQTTLHVTKDISFSIFAPGGQVSVSQVQQSFHQVPEPTTVLAGALLLLPLGASTLRILRRNRMS